MWSRNVLCRVLLSLYSALFVCVADLTSAEVTRDDLLSLERHLMTRIDHLESLATNYTRTNVSPCEDINDLDQFEEGLSTVAALEKLRRRVSKKQRSMERMLKELTIHVQSISSKLGVLNEIRRLYHRKCPAERGWIKRRLDMDGVSYCYKVYNDSIDWSWDSAERRCRSVGSHLVSVHGEEEFSVVDELLRHQNMKHAWIGLVDIAMERHKSKEGWIWSDGTKYNWNAGWAAGQPNSAKGDQDCVFHKAGSGWYDYQCTRIYTSYICKMKLQ